MNAPAVERPIRVTPFGGARPHDPPQPEDQSQRCLWCGRRLRSPKHATAAEVKEGHRGDYADNAFCGLRCGWAFGVTAARLGLRLEPREES